VDPFHVFHLRLRAAIRDNFINPRATRNKHQRAPDAATVGTIATLLSPTVAERPALAS
jgi:hypothetical protein